MTAGKAPSDEELLFSVELLTIPQVAKWAKYILAEITMQSSQHRSYR
jgi:hypothetical protein